MCSVLSIIASAFLLSVCCWFLLYFAAGVSVPRASLEDDVRLRPRVHFATSLHCPRRTDRRTDRRSDGRGPSEEKARTSAAVKTRESCRKHQEHLCGHQTPQKDNTGQKAHAFHYCAGRS